MRRLLSISLFILFSGKAFSQATEPIQADRPDQTESASLTPTHYVQMELGLSREQIDKESRSLSLPSLLLKYGANDRFEFRLIAEWTDEKNRIESVNGFKPLAVGFKAAICEEKGIIPKTSFIGHLSLPKLASQKFQSKYFAPDFRFTMQHTLSPKISLGYNLGAEWDGETAEPTFIYTLTSGFSLMQKMGFYVELYGFAPQDNKSDHRIDAGFTYLVNNDLLLDISGGQGISKNSPDHYVAIGFSYRFNTKKKNN